MTVNLLQHISESCILRAVLPPRSDGKKVLLPIAAGQDVAALIDGHLVGHLPSVLIRTEDGREWTENRAEALAACPVVGEVAHWFATDHDAAGHGHTTKATPESAHLGAMAAADLLHEAGLPVIVAASGGGSGRHVWSPQRMPSRMAAWLVSLIRKQVLARVPDADVEVRPGTDRQPGAPLILPMGGAYAAVGGGIVLRNEPGKIGGIDGLTASWQRHRDDEDRIAVRRTALRDARRHDGEVNSAEVPLRDVLESLTTITTVADNGTFRARCPIHGGDWALTGNHKRRIWRCWVCGRSGAGDAASYLLAAFLLGDPSPKRVFAALSEISHVHA